ncbi:SigE family RNA polymerase sigma factor [Micromonospora sp. SL1-18]|uniref:SigE family RNA polymerase sigma factor n=1 Tax=Micromonospora sp. SL1-18 TaxID=3399128 RepID=UPI003A4DF32F
MTFEEYVGSRGPALLRLARLLTGDEHRAEDLTQDVLARAYVHWRKIARADRPDVYVRRMLVNANNSWWRRRSNRELAVDTFAERADRDDVSGEAADRDEMWRLIRALPDRQRAVLVLRYYEDLDDATIAQILDCSPVTVRTHAMRALTHLRERCGIPTTNGSQS